MSGAAARSGAGRALRAHGLRADRIEAASRERLRAALGGHLPPGPCGEVAVRVAYAAGEPRLAAELRCTGAAASAAAAALAAGAPLVCDVAMVTAGVRASVAPLGCELLCAVEAEPAEPAPGAVSAATREAIATSTRTARGLLALAARLDGAVVAIGTAPTALLALLDLLADGVPAPAAIVATCCGLVAAAEAKRLLLEAPPAPSIVLPGARGGAALAAAAVNACARLAAGPAGC